MHDLIADCALAIGMIKASDNGLELPGWLVDVVTRAYVRNDRKATTPPASVIQGMVQNA